MKTLLLITLSLASIYSFGQGQVGNGDMESWESVSGNEEPLNWNSFLTASGFWSGSAQNQIEQSADVRPGSTGTKSCRIWSNSIFGIIANGNLTLGQINMGSTTPTNEANYNSSITSNTEHSETLADRPDSLVFWAKFTPTSGSGNARLKAVLHDDYDYQDPEDASSLTHIVASAVLNYPSTNGSWVRFSVPFNYSGPASVNTHVLMTFTTNESPGGGSGDDEVLIDDVELIYNVNSLNDISISTTTVIADNETDRILINSNEDLMGEYSLFNMNGQKVQNGSISSEINFVQPNGVYFIVLSSNDKEEKFKVVKF